MRILLLNQDWFADQLRESGHEVRTAGLSHHLDIVLEHPLLHLDSVLSVQGNGFSPDVIIWLDNSAPVAIQGIEDVDVPCLFYSVDAQHHIDIHKNAAHMFDYTFVAQKEYLYHFHELGVEADWLPLWAPRYVEPMPTKEFGACFVGSLNPKLNPKRVHFFEELKKRVPVHIAQGDYWEIFPKAHIVINQSVKGDLNFRTFEAMMCGTTLLTEKIGNGQEDLFQDGVHLATYEANNSEHAAAQIDALLSKPDVCKIIAHNGRQEILRKHTAQHRAHTIESKIKSLQRKESKYRYLGAAMNYTVLSIPVGKQSILLQTKALLAALKCAETALRREEIPTTFQSFHLVIAALTYDRLSRSDAGTQTIFQFSEAYPDNQVFSCTKLRQLLNVGRTEEAINLAKVISPGPPNETFVLANNVVTEILALADDDD